MDGNTERAESADAEPFIREVPYGDEWPGVYLGPNEMKFVNDGKGKHQSAELHMNLETERISEGSGLDLSFSGYGYDRPEAQADLYNTLVEARQKITETLDKAIAQLAPTESEH